MMASEMASNTFPWLTLAIFVPIVFGLLVLAVGRDDRPGLTRGLSLIGSIAGFLVTIPLYTGFNTKTAAMQFVEKTSWIEAFNVNYHLGVDGISLWFVLLTAFITIIVVLAGWEVITSRVAQYMAAFLILSGLMVGVFAALDGMLFYVFFEATLIPMYIIVGVGRTEPGLRGLQVLPLHADGLAADAGGLHLPVERLGRLVRHPVLAPAQARPDAADPDLRGAAGGLRRQGADVAGAHLAAGRPRRGAHGRLHRAGRDHAEAGRLRLPALSLPIAPDASHSLSGLMIALSLIAVIYIGLVAIVQDDMKKLVAYSSVAHMGFVTLGFFIFNTAGIEGAIVQMISHGFVSGAMFMCIGVLYDRMHSRRIADYGGVVNVMPRFATFFILFSMANSGLPATSGFVGEFMVIMGAVEHNFWIGLLAATALILGASYSLWMVKRVVLGDVANDHVRELTDINRREFLILGVMAIAVLYMGIYPKPFTDVMHVSVEALLQHVGVSKL